MSPNEIDQPRFAKCTELVVVCCHATYIGNGLPMRERDWLLQPFQRSNPDTNKPSEFLTFVQHIQAGLSHCTNRPETLLMFSGGRTTTSERTEAQSYRVVSDLLRASDPHVTRPNVATEDLATDSYQNFLFSILRFRKLTGRYPQSVVIITHAFKERRFLELHAAAIRWPITRIRVQGINPPFTLSELSQTQNGEMERAYALFAQDPYGARSPLADKRRARHWAPESADELAVGNAVKQLLAWDGCENGGEPFPGRLPWDDM